ncbi:family with sequence similarity 8, member A1b [Silurus asotus]|uniref:Family with sequence similarity 8, member A1b n=1 Tax=Silurus asotus TaxID=30991 RepID=A0AAD5AR14_SILAS|nr:family with sequence similarity 8, member A1b [Silurus asotus]
MADSLDGGVHDVKRTVSLSDSEKEMNDFFSPGSEPVSDLITTSQYCEKLQEWMWQYYCGYISWQSWASVFPFPPCLPAQATSGSLRVSTWGADLTNPDVRTWITHSFGVPLYSFPSMNVPSASPAANNTSGRQVELNGQSQNVPVPQHLQQNGNAQQPGREYLIPSPLHRFLAEMVDFFILFFIKATIILSIIHLCGMKDISKFAMHFIVEEIDEDTSMEELQKMMLVALVYRILVCFYEIICIWGAGGATPGKFLLGLRVVTCDTSMLVQPNRVRVVPATNVSLSASTIRALNKNFSIAFFFPAFITLLFFQHNRTVYDIVAGTIVVKRNRLR